MKKIMTLLMLLCSIALYAEKTEDKYVVQPVQAGLLYFIKPFDVPGVSGLQAARYDVTHILSSDSLTLNISLWLPEMINADSIVFHSAENMTITDFRTFFIDKEKKKYHHRYSCTLAYAYFRSVYQDRHPFTMTVYAGDRNFQYGFTEKSWQKESLWVNQILLLIDTNRQVQSMRK